MTTTLTAQQKLIGFQTAEWCLNYVAPAFIADPPNQEGGGIYTNGTCSFIDTGRRKFAVTNWHVIDAFRQKKAKKADLNFQIGSVVIKIDDHIISENVRRDLATFEITDSDLAVLHKQFCSCTQWPSPRVVNDELVVFAGYPGIFRSQLSLHEALFESVHMLEMVTSASSNQFGIHFDRDAWITQTRRRKAPGLSDLGGFSGAVVFRPKNAAITYLEPVGVIFEYSPSLDLQLIRHIDFINDDGSII
jgi:hypothetical protein